MCVNRLSNNRAQACVRFPHFFIGVQHVNRIGVFGQCLSCYDWLDVMALFSALQQSCSTLFFTEIPSTATQLGQQKIYHRFTTIVAGRHRVLKVFHNLEDSWPRQYTAEGDRYLVLRLKSRTDRLALPVSTITLWEQFWHIWTFPLFELNWTNRITNGKQPTSRRKQIHFIH